MFDLTVKTLDGQDHLFSVEEGTSIAQFKEQISTPLSVPAADQRLLFRGRVLTDETVLHSAEMGGKVVHLVTRPPPPEAVDSSPVPSVQAPQSLVDAPPNLRHVDLTSIISPSRMQEVLRHVMDNLGFDHGDANITVNDQGAGAELHIDFRGDNSDSSLQRSTLAHYFDDLHDLLEQLRQDFMSLEAQINDYDSSDHPGASEDRVPLIPFPEFPSYDMSSDISEYRGHLQNLSQLVVRLNPLFERYVRFLGSPPSLAEAHRTSAFSTIMSTFRTIFEYLHQIYYLLNNIALEPASSADRSPSLSLVDASRFSLRTNLASYQPSSSSNVPHHVHYSGSALRAGDQNRRVAPTNPSDFYPIVDPLAPPLMPSASNWMDYGQAMYYDPRMREDPFAAYVQPTAQQPTVRRHRITINTTPAAPQAEQQRPTDAAQNTPFFRVQVPDGDPSGLAGFLSPATTMVRQLVEQIMHDVVPAPQNGPAQPTGGEGTSRPSQSGPNAAPAQPASSGTSARTLPYIRHPYGHQFGTSHYYQPQYQPQYTPQYAPQYQQQYQQQYQPYWVPNNGYHSARHAGPSYSDMPYVAPLSVLSPHYLYQPFYLSSYPMVAHSAMPSTYRPFVAMPQFYTPGRYPTTGQAPARYAAPSRPSAPNRGSSRPSARTANTQAAPQTPTVNGDVSLDIMALTPIVTGGEVFVQPPAVSSNAGPGTTDSSQQPTHFSMAEQVLVDVLMQVLSQVMTHSGHQSVQVRIGNANLSDSNIADLSSLIGAMRPAGRSRRRSHGAALANRAESEASQHSRAPATESSTRSTEPPARPTEPSVDAGWSTIDELNSLFVETLFSSESERRRSPLLTMTLREIMNNIAGSESHLVEEDPTEVPSLFDGVASIILEGLTVESILKWLTNSPENECMDQCLEMLANSFTPQNGGTSSRYRPYIVADDIATRFANILRVDEGQVPVRTNVSLFYIMRCFFRYAAFQVIKLVCLKDEEVSSRRFKILLLLFHLASDFVSLLRNALAHPDRDMSSQRITELTGHFPNIPSALMVHLLSRTVALFEQHQFPHSPADSSTDSFIEAATDTAQLGDSHYSMIAEMDRVLCSHDRVLAFRPRSEAYQSMIPPKRRRTNGYLNCVVASDEDSPVEDPLSPDVLHRTVLQRTIEVLDGERQSTHPPMRMSVMQAIRTESEQCLAGPFRQLLRRLLAQRVNGDRDFNLVGERFPLLSQLVRAHCEANDADEVQNESP